MVGYRFYESADVAVRYPFGHGLSYTTFATTDLEATSTGVDTAEVRLNVTNTGAVAGKHVVQLYISTTAGPVQRPHRELRAFAKVHLESGARSPVDFMLDRRAFAYWDVERNAWVVPEGTYSIQIGESSSDIVAQVDIALDGDDLIPAVSLQSTLGEWLAHPLAGPALAERVNAILERRGQDVAEGTEMMRMITSMPMIQMIGLAGGAIDGEWLTSLVDGTRP
jgi:beta-glucosidase